MARLTRLGGWMTWPRAAAFLFILAFLLAAANALWTAHEVRQSQQRWCATLNTLSDASRGAPPATATGQRLFAGFAELRDEFGCR